MTARRPLVVILRALKLGDLLTGVPAMRAVADAYPSHRRVLAAPAYLEPLVRHIGMVDEVAPTPGLRPLDPRLADPDVAVDLHGRGPGSQPLLLALRPRRLIAFAHPDVAGTADGPRWRADEHEVRRWCRLLTESGIPADPSRLDIEPPDFPARAWARGATIVHPGAASPARQWPPERFAEVARAELDAGRRVLITGTAEELGLARRVARLAGLLAEGVVAGGTDLLMLASLVGAAGRVVSGDTGIAHLATALATPSVVLFGPVPPPWWGPPPERPWHRALWAGSTGDPHGGRADPGLLRITVDDVQGALADLPTSPRWSARRAPEVLARVGR